MAKQPDTEIDKKARNAKKKAHQGHLSYAILGGVVAVGATLGLVNYFNTLSMPESTYTPIPGDKLSTPDERAAATTDLTRLFGETFPVSFENGVLKMAPVYERLEDFAETMKRPDVAADAEYWMAHHHTGISRIVFDIATSRLDVPADKLKELKALLPKCQDGTLTDTQKTELDCTIVPLGMNSLRPDGLASGSDTTRQSDLGQMYEIIRDKYILPLQMENNALYNATLESAPFKDVKDVIGNWEQHGDALINISGFRTPDASVSKTAVRNVFESYTYNGSQALKDLAAFMPSTNSSGVVEDSLDFQILYAAASLSDDRLTKGAADELRAVMYLREAPYDDNFRLHTESHALDIARRAMNITTRINPGIVGSAEFPDMMKQLAAEFPGTDVYARLSDTHEMLVNTCTATADIIQAKSDFTGTFCELPGPVKPGSPNPPKP